MNPHIKKILTPINIAFTSVCIILIGISIFLFTANKYLDKNLTDQKSSNTVLQSRFDTLQQKVDALVSDQKLLTQEKIDLENEIKDVKSQLPAQTNTGSKPIGGPTINQIKSLFRDNYITFGSPDAKVIFVEFTDPSCPFCHYASGKDSELAAKSGTKFKYVQDGGTYVPPVPEMKKIVDQGKAAFVWIYSNGHGNGEMGAKALYCANDKGKFWEAHDIIMSNKAYDLLNNTIKNDKSKSAQLADLLQAAVPVLDMKSCLDSGKYDSIIKRDQNKSAVFSVQGTPSFYVNEKFFAGAYDYFEMKDTVDAAFK